MREASSHWYVMLVPDDPIPRDCQDLIQRVAARTGGMPETNLHVTIAYFIGHGHAIDVASRLRKLAGPSVPVRAGGAFSFRETKHPLFGYTLSLHAERSDALRAWHLVVARALELPDLTLERSWDQMRPHVRVVHHMAVSPGEAISRLSGQELSLRFTATRLWVTELANGTFQERLNRSLQAGSYSAE